MKEISNFPLNIIIIGMHHHGPQEYTTNARKLLKVSPKVKSYGSIDNLDEAYALIVNSEINVIFLDPWVTNEVNEITRFVKKVRIDFPNIVFVIYAEDFNYKRLLEHESSFSHYFYLHYKTLQHYSIYHSVSSEETDASNKNIEEILFKCQETLYEYHNYDVAISFAGEDREIARELASSLVSQGNRVFFDEFFESDLLGKDLFSHLQEIYSNEARYCVMLISKSYIQKKWTVHERKSAQTRVFENMGMDYILPIRLDNSNVPGVFSTLGYLSIKKGVVEISQIITQKLWLPLKDSHKKLIGYSKPEYERWYK